MIKVFAHDIRWNDGVDCIEILIEEDFKKLFKGKFNIHIANLLQTVVLFGGKSARIITTIIFNYEEEGICLNPYKKEGINER